MKLGIFMMPLHRPGKPTWQCYEEDTEMVLLAEELGFSEVWIGEHGSIAWENIPANDTFIASLIPQTKKIRLGTGAVLLPQHHPAHTANRIAQLDQMSKGRINFGVGQGGVPSDWELFGLPNGRVQGLMTLEAIDMILKLWTAEAPFDFQGEFWRIKIENPNPKIGMGAMIRPYQQPHPPMAMGLVKGTSMAATMCGERGWLPLSTSLVPIETVPMHWKLYCDGAAKAGRPAPSRAVWRISRSIFVGETNDEAWEFARNSNLGHCFPDYFYPLIGGARSLDVMKRDPSMPDSALDMEYALKNFSIIGDPKSCVEQIKAIWELTGGFGTLLMIAHDWDDKPRWRRCMELLAREVIPALPAIH